MNSDELADLRFRVRALETALSLRGMFSSSGDIDQLRTQIKRLSSLVETGNTSYGGPIRANNGPVMWTVGPFRESIDNTFDIDFDLWVPDNLLRLIRVQCRLRPRPIRSSMRINTSASGTLTSEANDTTSSGASDTTSSGASSSSTAQNNDHTHSNQAPTPGFTDAGGADSHQHFFEYNRITGGGGSHNHGMSHFHTISHQHNINHKHPIPSHVHTTDLGIAEGGNATNVRFHIDGVDRSAVLGGPWNSSALFDITQYLVNVRNEPVAGAHPIKLESATVGAVEIWFDFYGIAKVPS